MNLIDAVKSGRPFRRKGLGSCWVTAGDQGMHWSNGGRNYTLEDILHDDYEIQEPEVRITRAQFWEAIFNTKNDHGICYGKDIGSMLSEAARRLGLES